MSGKRVQFNLETATCGVLTSGLGREDEEKTCQRPAAAFCKSCGYFLCQGCLKPHRKLVVMKSHVLLNRDHAIDPDNLSFFDAEHVDDGNGYGTFGSLLENLENAKSKIHDESLDAYEEYRTRVLKLLVPEGQSKLDQTENIQINPTVRFTEPCTTHEDSNIMYFCETHTKLCCEHCRDEHRTCTTHLKYIPDELPCNAMYKDSLDRLFEQVGKFKEQDRDFQSDLKQLKKSKDNFLHDLKNMKRNVIDWVNLMEVRAVRRVEIVYDKCRKEVDDRRRKAKECIDKLRAETYFLQEIIRSESHDDVYKYIKSKQAEAVMKGTNTHVNRQYTNTRFSLKLNFEFAEVKNVINHLYELHFEVKGEDKFNARLKEDRFKCNITGCALLSNEDLVLTDRANSKVKRFDRYLKPLTSLTIDVGVFDLSVRDSSCVAVTVPMSNKINVVELTPEMRIVQEVQTGHGTCWGVTCHKNLFIVNISTQEGSFIRVINHDSHIVQEFETKCNFYSAIRNFPEKGIEEIVVVSSFVEGTDNKMVYYVNEYGTGEQDSSLALGSFRVSEYNFLNHLHTRGLELDLHGNPVVCCKDTDQIYTVSRNGSEAELLLAESDGLCRPQSLCYNSSKDRLVVTSENTDFIQIFKFENIKI